MAFFIFEIKITLVILIFHPLKHMIMQKYNSVSAYIEGQNRFGEELRILRGILTATELEETMKWGMPTYCLDNKNIIGVAAFKHHFCIWFHQGALIADHQNLLINAQKGKTRAMRQMRFEHIQDINPETVLDYVQQAIQNHKNGREIKVNRSPKPVEVPIELKTHLDENNALKSSFSSLSQAKQRAYCEYISSAKREATKQSRLEKITPLILKGVGLNDQYR